MTDIRGMRDIKTVQGSTSCTYLEAVLKLSPHYKNYMQGTKTDQFCARSFAAALAVIFERDGIQTALDLERGTP